VAWEVVYASLELEEAYVDDRYDRSRNDWWGMTDLSFTSYC
jgi:hypothetical protein